MKMNGKYDYGRKQKYKSSNGAQLPKGCYEMKVDMPRSKEAPYSVDNGKEYAHDLKIQDAYMKKNRMK